MPDRTPAAEPAPVPPPVDALRCFEHDFSVVAEHTEGDVTVCLGCGERGDEAGPGWLDRLVTAAVAYGDRREVDSAGSDMYHSASDDTLDVLIAEIKTVWAAGVAEGRRLAEDEFDNRSTYELAGLVHRYLHVEAPDNSDPVQVAIEVLEEAIQDHGTDGALETRGIAEGRRQRDAEIHASVFTSARLAAAEAGFGPAPESVTVSYDVTTDPQTAFDLGVAEGRRQATEERAALVLDTTERTLRTAANWLESDEDSSMLVESANAVKSQGADEACCPVCEEVECDGDCPLATLRTAADGG